MTRAMAGGGEYDRHSDYQLRGALTHRQRILDAARRIATEGRAAITLADYGCAQGRVSEPLLRDALATVREAAPELPCFVVHNDQPSNDWATLIGRVTGESDPLPGGPVTHLVSATSFYEPVTPPGQVDLGISFAALQWLAEPGPSDGGTALYFDQLDEPTRARMAERAHRDWTRFLELRAAELAPGGRLVLDMMGVPAGGVAAGHDLWNHLRATAEELADEGLVDRGALVDYVIPVYERTVAEVRRPFDEALADRLVLEELSIESVPNPVLERYRADGDAAAMASGLVGFVRAFSEPSLRVGLALDDAGVEQLYARLEARVRRDAARIAFDVHPIGVVVRGHG